MAGETYRYNIVISASLGTRGVKTGADAADREMSRMEKRAQKLQSQFERLSKAIDVATAANERASRAGASRTGGSNRWTEEEKAIKKASSLLDKYDNQVARLKGYDGEVRRLNKALSQEGVGKSIDETTKALLREKAAVVDNIKEAQKLQKEQEKAARERSATSRRRVEASQTIGSGMQTAGVGLTAILTAPVIAGFAKAIEIGSQYEQSMNKFGAVTSATAEEMKRADQVAIQLGNDLSLPGVSAKDAAEAMEELGKAGMTASESMEAAKGTLQLATAANISAAKAAEITANALNMFSLQAGEAGRVSDLLAGAANASSAEITDIAQSLQQAGAVFANAKVPIEDVVALIAELANQGIKGSDAGTSLKTMMQRLQSPTANAAAAMKALNVQVYDQSGAMKPMRDIIGQFENSLKGLSQQQKDQALNTIFGADAVRAATIIFSQGAEGFDKIKEAVMRANAAQDLAAARTKGLAGSWEAFTSQLETFGLIVYNRIKALLTELIIIVATIFGKITDAFSALPEGVQIAILALAAITAAIGPVLAVVGTLIIAFGGVASGLMALTGAATVGAALSALAPVVAVVTAVIAALTAGITAAIGVVWGLVEAWENGFGPVASVVAIGVGLIVSAFSPIFGLPVLIGATLAAIYGIWTTNFGGLRDTAIMLWDKIKEITGAALQRLYELTNAVAGRIVAWWDENYPLIQETIENVSNSIKEIVSTFLGWLSEFWESNGDSIMQSVETVWNFIKQVVMLATDQILDIVRMFIQLFRGDWEGAWQTFLIIIKRAAENAMQLMGWLHRQIINAVKMMGTWLQNNWQAILIALGKIILTGILYIVDLWASLPSRLVSLAPKFLEAGKSIASALWEGMKSGWNTGFSGSDNPIGTTKTDSTFDLSKWWNKEDPNDPRIQAITEARKRGLKTDKDWLGNLSVEITNKDLQKAGMKDFVAALKQAGIGVTNLDEKGKGLLDTLKGLGDAGSKFNKELSGIGGKKGGQKKGDASDDVWTSKEIAAFARKHGFTVTSTTGGKHNIGSNHYRGLAADLRTRDKTADEIIAFQMAAEKAGLRVIDERTRPAGQKVWGGPHLHVQDAKLSKRGEIVKGRVAEALANEPKTFDQLADESLFNDAKQRVQSLISLSRELNVALTVPAQVTSSNEALAVQQKVELKNLQDLKSKREDIEQTVARLGLKQEDYARADLAQSTASIKRLEAVDEAQRFVNATYDDSVEKLRELEVTAGKAITPLQQFNLNYEKMWKQSGKTREEFDLLNPKLEETRKNLQKIADTELAIKVAANFKEFHEAIDKEIAEIDADIRRVLRETSRLGLTGPQRDMEDAADRAAARQKQIDALRGTKEFKESDKATQDKYLEDLQRKLNRSDEYDAANRAFEATKIYNDEVRALNDAIREHLNLTDAQKLEYDLVSGSLRGLTEEQKNHLRLLVQQVEVQRKIDRYNEEVRQLGDSFGQIFADSFTALFEEGVSGSLKALGRGLKAFFFDIIGHIANAIKQKISNAIVDALGIGQRSNSGQSGGGIFDTLFSGLSGIFNPGRAAGGGTGNRTTTAGTQASNVMASSNLTALANLGSAAPNFASNAFTGDVPAFTSNATSTPLGGAMRQIASGLPTTLAAGAHGGMDAATALHEGIHAGAGGVGRLSKLGQLKQGLGGMLPMLGASLGGLMGGSSGIGQIMGSIGGLAAGTLGAIATGALSAGTMLGGIFGAGGALAIGGLSAAMSATVVLAPIAAALIIGSFFHGRNAARKRDEKTRNTAILDAFSALDKLIADVGADKIDGASALAQADEIRKNYMEQMSKLKDKKTRNIALADVSRIDAKITALKAAVKNQENRKERMAQLTPTFADGGATSSFMNNSYRHNPLGYISGPGSSRSDSIDAYFPAAGQFAKLSNTEYVLDAVTTRNIGVKNLDALRADKGRSFGQAAHILKRMRSPIKFAEGGAAGESGDSGFFRQGGSIAGGDIKVEVRNTIIEGPDGGVSTEVYLTTPQGKRKIEGIIAETVYENGRDGKIPKAIRDVHK